MNEKQKKLAIGCLLHDFGKLLYRYNDGRNHSTSGYEYLKKLPAMENEREILNCVKFHHAGHLESADVENNDICYIAYIADNIASASDRRKKETAEGGFVRNISSESIFNILNHNNGQSVYKPYVLSAEAEINYPTEDNVEYNEEFYGKIVDNIKNSLMGIEFTDEYVNSLLQLLECNLSFIPSSTQVGELRDISLYDHLKLTAAFGLCIEQYLDEKNIYDYETELFKNAQTFYDKKAFRICSIDMSGIQSFIYNISSEGALKGLRARSFYLELLMEHCVDELLERCNLCRANVMYTGGGHTYIIMPATEKNKIEINNFENELNRWFIKIFGIELFAAMGYCDCSSNDLKNCPDGSYKEIFRTVSSLISEKKLKRYTAENILEFNAPKNADHSRECKICSRSDMLNDESECIICSGLKKLSDMIISDKSRFFAIVKETKKDCVPMPFDCYAAAYTENELVELMKNESGKYVRAFSKNKGYTGYKIASNMWVGDYAAEKSFHDLAENSGIIRKDKKLGIKRLAVLRADVDNLGQAFVSGFDGKNNSITRTAVFSRKLSEFFKLHINNILSNAQFQLYSDKKEKKRNAVIVYAGGDDVFVIGGWDDIIGFAVDLYNSLKKFAQGTLTISAGIGIYSEKFPISSMASKTGELEDNSKKYNNNQKNAVTLFDENSVFSWDDFINSVIGEKLRALQSYIDMDGDHAKAMLYNMLSLIRAKEEDNKLNIARFAYLLARLRPDKEQPEEKIESYNVFAEKMYEWVRSENDCKELITAIYIYVYMYRER